jgi:hypothetical protein
MRRWDRLLDSYIEEYAARGVSKESVAMNRARIECRVSYCPIAASLASSEMLFEPFQQPMVFHKIAIELLIRFVTHLFPNLKTRQRKS